MTEVLEGDDKGGLMVAAGKISTEYPQWNIADIPGIYDYEDLAFEDPDQPFWFELHENGMLKHYQVVIGIKTAH